MLATLLPMNAHTATVTGSSVPDRPITNTYWKLTELGGEPAKVAPNQREPHVILQLHENRLVGSGGCNRLTGQYQLAGSSVYFGKVAVTKMACPEGMDQEQAFLRALDSARAWRVEGDKLALLDDGGETIARFVAVDL
jgi:heat shock protein HslJ